MRSSTRAWQRGYRINRVPYHALSGVFFVPCPLQGKHGVCTKYFALVYMAIICKKEGGRAPNNDWLTELSYVMGQYSAYVAGRSTYAKFNDSQRFDLN